MLKNIKKLILVIENIKVEKIADNIITKNLSAFKELSK